MTRKAKILGLILAVVAGGPATPLLAQRALGPRAPGGPNIGRSVDIVLEHQEALGLTDQQVAELQELKVTVETDVTPLAEEMRALRAQVRDGAIDRTEGFREMEALRGEMITAAAPLRGRVQEILTAEQHNQLRTWIRGNRPGPGRGAALRGPGLRPGRGMVPGRGRGGRRLGPGGGWRLGPGGR
jgi:Spy/CpxP family protein refolding chaperone